MKPAGRGARKGNLLASAGNRESQVKRERDVKNGQEGTIEVGKWAETPVHTNHYYPSA